MSRLNVANFRHPDGTADNITFDSSTNATVAGNLTASGNLTVNGTGNQSIAGTLQFNSGYGSVATAYGVRAWINFDGTSSSIGTGRANGNMDAVTDNGTGDYTLNFTNDMPDANYAFMGNCERDATNYTADVWVGVRAAGSVDIYSVIMNNNSAPARYDLGAVFAAIVR